MNRHKIAEVICVVILVVFIAFLTSEEKVSDKTANQMGKAVSSAVDIKGLKKQDKMAIKKELSLSWGAFDGIFYLKSDDIMDVREILLIKLKEGTGGNEAVKLIEKRLKERQALFDGYAPEQSALLQNYRLKEKGGFIFCVVSAEADMALSAFNKNL